MSYIDVEGTSLKRDPTNMALLESDLRTKNEYISKKKLLLENRKLKNEMLELKTRLENIEKLLIKENN